VLDLDLQHLPEAECICEFGVFEAQTIDHITRQLPHRSVFGFDSLAGLPQDWRPDFGAGAFSSHLPKVEPNVAFHEFACARTLCHGYLAYNRNHEQVAIRVTA